MKKEKFTDKYKLIIEEGGFIAHVNRDSNVFSPIKVMENTPVVTLDKFETLNNETIIARVAYKGIHGRVKLLTKHLPDFLNSKEFVGGEWTGKLQPTVEGNTLILKVLGNE